MATNNVDQAVSAADGVTLFDSETRYSPFPPGGKVCGSVAPGWESVKDAFAQNFAEGLERGAQVCIMQGNKTVVDLYGVAEGTQTEPPSSYSHDTVQAIFSSGKNLEPVIVAILVDRGLISYDDPISKHWPAFGRNGKASITISDLMRHSAGMAYFIDPNNEEKFRFLTAQDIEAREPMHKVMETSPPQQHGSTKRTYHGLTRGLVLDGIIKHVDPAGRTIGQFARDEIFKPLGIDDQYFVSLTPDDIQKLSVATMEMLPVKFSLCHQLGPAAMGAGDPVIQGMLGVMGPSSIISRSGWGTEMLKDPKTGLLTPPSINKQPVRRIEATSAFSFASARAMSTLLSLFPNGGETHGVRLFSEETAKCALDKIVTDVDESLMAECGICQSGLVDVSSIQGANGTWSPKACYKGFYGWGGWGGSVNLFHPEKNVTFSYAMTAMGNNLIGDERSDRILKAVTQVME